MKKKFLFSTMVIAILIFAFGIISASAETEDIYTYKIVDGKATITKCSSTAQGEIIIPETLDGYPVVSIANSAFSNCTGLTDVIIPDSITSIGECAFINCNGLISLSIGKNVTNIGDGAFASCYYLSQVSWNAKNVTNISSNSNIFGSYTGSKGSGINVVFGDLVENIPDYLFVSGSSSNGVKLVSVIIGNSVTSIGYMAFYNATTLSEVIIGNSVTNIGKYAFYNCDGITRLIIPDSVINIENYAFYSCNNITDVYYSRTEEEWNNIKIGLRNDPLLNANIHFNLDLLKYIQYEIKDDKVIIKDCETSFTGKLVIPSKIEGYPVTIITTNAFRDCIYITDVTIPDCVEQIGSYAFINCTGLKSVDIGDGTTGIGISAFQNCKNLVDLILGNNVKTINNAAFYDCENLKNITFPDGLENIGNMAFKGCKSLTSFTIPDSVKSIGNNAFLYCEGLTDVMIGNGLTNIEKGTFYYCRNLSNVIIGNCVKTIDESAFEGCAKVQSITIPDSVETIGKNSFYYCSDLTEITIPNSVKNIGVAAFKYCSKLEKIIIPDSLTTICDETFFGCYSLKNITIPVSLTNVNFKAFYGCNSLTDVYYSGSEEDWGKILISTYNESFTNATIHYNGIEVKPGNTGNYGDSASSLGTIFTNNMAYDGTNWSCNLVLFSSDTVSGTVYVAVYEGNQFKKAIQYNATTHIPVSVECEEGQKVKIFWWDENLVPMSLPAEIEI